MRLRIIAAGTDYVYCTYQNVRDTSELLEDATVIPDQKILTGITKAQGRIDTVLRSRYVVPLADPVPEIIKGIAQDMATGFVLANTFSNQLGQELINLSNQFLKRADNDLAMVIEKHQLDDVPGVRLVTLPGGDSSPAISSTTKRTSPIEEIITKW